MTVNGYVNTTPLSPKIRTEKLFTRIKLTPNFWGEGSSIRVLAKAGYYKLPA